MPTTKSYLTSPSASSGYVEFVFPYPVDGVPGPEFEARACGTFVYGELDDFTDIEVLAGGEYRKPDDALHSLILAWLRDSNEAERFVEAMRENGGPDPDFLRDRKQDFDMERVVWDPPYRETVKRALKASGPSAD